MNHSSRTTDLDFAAAKSAPRNEVPHVGPQIGAVTATPVSRYRIRILPAVALLLAAVLVLYWRTTLSMISIWETSSSFTHGFVVIPIFFYLLWTRREALALVEPRPCFPALLGILSAGVLWLVGELVSAISVSQFAMMAMVPFAVWAVLGTRVVKTIGIPLAFLFFAVPAGDFLVPTMMDWTANFTIAALRASGVPVYREGNFFMIPSGAWSVVEACSGLRYLIASFMIGCLYAYLSYRSALRRALFIAASLIVPIIANWLRAYMIVMLGHLTNNRIAAGADHLIYGWVLFGVVMMLLLWAGSRWREDQEPHGEMAQSQIGRLESVPPQRRTWVVLLAALALIAVWQPVRAYFNAGESLERVTLGPIAGTNGWVAIPEELSPWRPDVAGARIELRQTFQKSGARVGLHIAFFRDQTKYAKAVSSTNQLVRPTNDSWHQLETRAVAAEVGAAAVRVRSAVVAGNGERLAAWQWYWVDFRVTSSDYVAKFYQAISVLLGRGDPTAWVVVYTTTTLDEAQVRPILQAFTMEMGAPIEAALKQAASE
jgi:exosortase A